MSRWRVFLLALLGLLVLMGASPVISSPVASALRTSAGTVLYMGAPSDGQNLCRSGTTIAGCSGSGLGGSTGATDNAVLRADGTGGSTLQASAVGIDDSGNVAGVATIDVGSISTTLSQSSPGNLAVEGNVVYRAGGTDVPLTDGGTGASDRRTAVANLWARPRLRVLYTAQGDGLFSERGAPAGLMSNQVNAVGDRLYWTNYTLASASAVGFTTLVGRYMYSTGGPYMAIVERVNSFTTVRFYTGAQSGSTVYTNGRTAFGATKYMGFALDTALDTTLQFVTSDGSTISTTNTAVTPTAGGWLFLEWYLQGSTIYWTAANCGDIDCASYSSSASGTHTGSLPSAQSLGWQASLIPASGVASLAIDVAYVEVGQR